MVTIESAKKSHNWANEVEEKHIKLNSLIRKQDDTKTGVSETHHKNLIKAESPKPHNPKLSGEKRTRFNNAMKSIQPQFYGDTNQITKS